MRSASCDEGPIPSSPMATTGRVGDRPYGDGRQSRTGCRGGAIKPLNPVRPTWRTELIHLGHFILARGLAGVARQAVAAEPTFNLSLQRPAQWERVHLLPRPRR